MVASIGASGASNRADSVFSKLDTKNQGFIDKADLQGALDAAGGSGKGPAVDVDAAFGALDGDSDGKVSKSELSEAMDKLSDQLNAQFDASRMANGGGQPPGGAPPGGEEAASGMGGAPRAGGAGGPRGGGGARETQETDGSASSTYVAAADTDGDGTVSETEQAEYDKKLASGAIDENGKEAAAGDGAGKTQGKPPRDPMRELAHAMDVLKAYADDGGAASNVAAGISVEA